jgi:hypothetical protein
MRQRNKIWLSILLSVTLFPTFSFAQSAKENATIKENNAKIAEYKKWLDQLGANGAHYWLRLDATHRPHRLYVGEAFEKAKYSEQENFVEIFSRYLAGHPDKNMLIDIYDASSGKEIGEYGFGGFKLFSSSLNIATH